MPRIDQVIDIMLDHRAQEAVLLSESPVSLRTDHGEEAVRTFGHRQLTSLVEEILPEDLFLDLLLMEPVEFDYQHETATYHLRIVPGPSIWRVVIIKQATDAKRDDRGEKNHDGPDSAAKAEGESKNDAPASAESDGPDSGPETSERTKSGTFLGVGKPPGVDHRADDESRTGSDTTTAQSSANSPYDAQANVQQGIPKHPQLGRETPIQIPDPAAHPKQSHDSSQATGEQPEATERPTKRGALTPPGHADSSAENRSAAYIDRQALPDDQLAEDKDDHLDDDFDPDEDDSLDTALDDEEVENLSAGFQATIDGESAADLDIDLEAVRAGIEQRPNDTADKPVDPARPTGRRNRPAYATHPGLPHNTPADGHAAQSRSEEISPQDRPERPSPARATWYPSLLEAKLPRLDELIGQARAERSPEIVLGARQKPWILGSKGYGLMGSQAETDLVDELLHGLSKNLRNHLENKGWTRFLYDEGLGQSPVRCTLTSGRDAKVVVRIPLVERPTPSILGIPEGTVDGSRDHGLILVAGRHRSGRTTSASALATALLTNGRTLGLLAGHPPELRPAVACPLATWDGSTAGHDGTVFDAAHSLSAGFVLLDDANPQTLGEAVALARDGLGVVAVIHARSSLDAAYRLLDACMTTTMNPVSLLEGTVRSILYQVLLPNRSEDGYVSAYERLVPTRALWEELAEGSGKLLADVLPSLVRPSLTQSIHALDRTGRIPPSVATRLLKKY